MRARPEIHNTFAFHIDTQLPGQARRGFFRLRAKAVGEKRLGFGALGASSGRYRSPKPKHKAQLRGRFEKLAD
jgi:hypothetical protein